MQLIKRLVNRARDLAFFPGAEKYWRARLLGKVVALVYHRVAESVSYGFLTQGGVPVIRPKQLLYELTWLQQQGARFLTFADLRAGRFPGADEFGVIVTFDDCFRDNYTTGMNILQIVGINAVFFQCSGMVGTVRLIPEHALYFYASQRETAPLLQRLACDAGWVGVSSLQQNLLKLVVRWLYEVPVDSLHAVLQRLRESIGDDEELQISGALYPDADQLRAATAAGHEIGSHGHDHLNRFTLDAKAFERELSHSQTLLTQLAGIEPSCFSHPFNAYFSGDKPIWGRYFRQAATVDGGYITRDCDPLALPRFSWPGHPANGLRLRRWLLTGRI